MRSALLPLITRNTGKPDSGRYIPTVEELGAQLAELPLSGKKQDRMRRVGFAERRNTGTDRRFNEKTYKYCLNSRHTIEDC